MADDGLTFDVDARVLARLRARVRDFTPALKLIGAYLVGTSAHAFDEQKDPSSGREWRPRAVPNVMGILSDLEGGGQPKARRFQARPAARDTGRLGGSIAARNATPTSIEVGTTIHYANLIQRGGESTRRISTATQNRLRLWLAGPQGRALPEPQQARLRALTHADSVTVDVPSRPFVVFPKGARKVINGLLTTYLRNLREGKVPSGRA